MITYENSPVKIGDFYILAESASISIQNPARGTTRFGSPGYDSEVREGPAVGNVSVSYYLSDGDAGIRNLFAGDGVQLFDISVGPYQCYSGVANSMSMTIEPYSVVSCTLDVSFYNGYDQDGSIGDIPAPPSGVMHGGTTEASTDLLWADDIASVNYRMEQSISPVYALGGLVPSGYTREGGTIEVDLEGTGWGHIVDTGTICEGYTTGNIRLDALCGPCRDEVVYKAEWNRDPLIKQWRNVGADPTSWNAEGKLWKVLTTLDAYSETDHLCRPCWGVGDNVTITWPEWVTGVNDGEHPGPWRDGVDGYIRSMTDPPYCNFRFQMTETTGTPPITVKPPYFPHNVILPDGSTDTWSGAFHDITVKNHDLSLKPKPHIIPFSGYVINPSVALEPNSEIVGSLTVFDVF